MINKHKKLANLPMEAKTLQLKKIAFAKMKPLPSILMTPISHRS